MIPLLQLVLLLRLLLLLLTTSLLVPLLLLCVLLLLVMLLLLLSLQNLLSPLLSWVCKHYTSSIQKQVVIGEHTSGWHLIAYVVLVTGHA